MQTSRPADRDLANQARAGQRRTRCPHQLAPLQQSLGTGQFWAALAVVTVALIASLVIAFGSTGAAPAVDTPAAGFGVPAPAYLDRGGRGEMGTGASSLGVPAPAYLDRGGRGEIGTAASSLGVAPAFNDHGSRGEIEKVMADLKNGTKADLGYAPRTDDTNTGPTARRHFPR